MNDREIAQAIEDIAELKRSIRGTLKTLRPVMLDPVFVPFSLGAAVFYSLLFAAFHIGVSVWGSLRAAPFAFTAGLTALGAASFFFSAFIKRWIVSRGLARIGRNGSLVALLRDREFRTLYALVFTGYAGVLAIGFRIVGETGSWALVLPITALYIGFAIALFAIVFGVAEYFAVAAASALFGFAALGFMHSAPWLWLSAYSGTLLGSYAAVIALANRVPRAGGERTGAGDDSGRDRSR